MQSVQLMPSVSRLARLWLVVAGVLLAALLVPASKASAVAPDVPQGVEAESLGMDTVQVSWEPVAGATGYLVEYSTKKTFSSAKIYQRQDKPAEPAAYVDGLTRNSTYYFRVYALAGGEKSKASSSVSATPKYEYGSVDDLKPSNIGGTFAEVEWVFNTETLGTPGWRLRAEAVSDPEDAHVNDVGSDPVGKVRGLKKNTSYYVRVASLLPVNGDAPAVRVGPYSKAIKIKTSNYPVDSPFDLVMSKQESDNITLAWTAPANFKEGYRYQVQYARSASMKDAKSGGAPAAATSKSVTGLTPNVNYYMRVHVVGPDGKKVSDTSDVLQTKTPTARGTITGHVSGAPTEDLVVSAYASKTGMADKGNLVEEAEVDSAGNYSIAVRPGAYRVHVSYTGEGSYTSLWARANDQGRPILTEASDVPVVTNQVTQAPGVTLGAGGKVVGTVKDPEGSGLKAVDVTARSCYSEGSDLKRDVIAMAETSSAGGYELRGLADGWYWLRFVYDSGDGFEAAAHAVHIKDRKVDSVLASGDSCLKDTYTPKAIAEVNPVLKPKEFRKEYAIHVYGSRKVGTRLTSKFNRWIGSQYGTDANYARMDWVWTRNGAPIAGTSGNTKDNSTGSKDYCSKIRCTPSYKLTSKDRGKKVSLKVTYSRYGYITTTKSYKAFTVR